MRRLFRPSFFFAVPSASAALRRWQSGSSGRIVDADDEELQRELSQSISDKGAQDAALGNTSFSTGSTTATEDAAINAAIKLTKLDRVPGKFNLLSNSLAFEWKTTALNARKVTGPMGEWSGEIKYRTGVHIDCEPTSPEKIESYNSPDDVEMTVYLFGGERAVANCRKLLYAALQQDPSYVRLAVFRRVPDTNEVEWLLLRRINREMRPPDIPPISLKTPGKYTLFYEQHKEAAIRTLWEETGIRVAAKDVYPSKILFNHMNLFYWRVPVQYFVAEVPYDVKVKGPQSATTPYVQGWNLRLFQMSPDPIDRAWAQYADPVTGCGWLKASLIDDLQKPLRGENYMKRRYTPPPHSLLQEVVGFLEEVSAAASGAPSAASNSGNDDPKDGTPGK